MKPIRSLSLPFFVVLLLLSWSGAPAVHGAERELTMRWALGALDTDAVKPDAITSDTKLDPGTRLKFLVEPLSPASVYLMLLDSDEQIHVLYRKNAEVRQGSGDKPTYIPPGKQWFELEDGSGLETFFLLASVEPLDGLESLLAEHVGADGPRKAELAPKIVAEVRRLHKTHRKLARPVEKPMMIGGQTRGETDVAAAIDQLAVEVSAERFYAKTITIDH